MTIRTLSLAIALAFAPALQAAPQALLPAQADDLVPTRLVAAKSAPRADIERAPVVFAWALDSDQPLYKSAPYEARSREYWKRVSAAELQRGVRLHTTASGALLRLSPVAQQAKHHTLEASSLRLIRDGVELTGRAAFDQFADAVQLKAAGVEFPDHTLAFRLQESLGSGDFTLQLDGAAGDVLMHVFEPDSSEVLSLSAAKSQLLDGDTLSVDVRFDSAAGTRAGGIAGTVVAPNGRMFDLGFSRSGDGTWRGSAALDVASGSGEGLWEVHTTLWSEDGTLQRDARTAFAAALPTAKLGGSAEVKRLKGDTLRVALPVQVASASRYDVSGTLYGTADDGSLRPFAIAHSAAWLEPGSSTLALDFDPSLLKSGLQGPYELRDVTLTDQGALGTLERRGRALRFDLK